MYGFAYINFSGRSASVLALTESAIIRCFNDVLIVL